LHHRKEGWLRHQGNVAKPAKRKRDSAQPQVKLTQPGWFSFVFSVGKPSRPRDQRRLRGILLTARPPLLALMQGGEYARFSGGFHEFPSCYRSPTSHLVEFCFKFSGTDRTSKAGLEGKSIPRIPGDDIDFTPLPHYS